jgi:hypothetical protein
MDGLDIPNGERSNWHFLSGVTPTFDKGNFSHVNRSKLYYGDIGYILDTETFPMVQELPQSQFVCESYASHKLTYRIDHHGASGCHVNLHYLNVWR